MTATATATATATRCPSLKDTGCTWPSGIHHMVNSACTHCGFRETTVETVQSIPETNEKFESVWEAEMLVRGATASVLFAGNGVPLYRMDMKHDAVKRAKSELFTLVEAFTPEEARAYGEYRKQILAQIAAM